jgi:signal transduction histidine kinase
MDEALLGPLDQGSLEELRLQVEKLRASRARVAAAADALRRGIERDLHDGAQQRLVALAVNVQLALQLADSDPAALKTLLEEIGRDVHEALGDVRQLAWRIYPSLLLDRGLVEALRAAASDAVISTRVEATAVGRYSPEVEAAVYFCCLEALQNAGEEAKAGERATIRVRQEQGTLLFEVIVDGAVFEQWTKRDLTSMSDRLGALGGRLTISSEAGRGAFVSGTIPLSP